MGFLKDLIFGKDEEPEKEEKNGKCVPPLKFSPYGKTVVLSNTIRVEPEKVFDGKLPDGKLTRYYGSSGMGDGSQAENQKALFLLMPGAILKNVVIDAPGCDGVHIRTAPGKVNRITNVEWRDVGEDAITIEDGDNDANVIIENCKFAHAADKIIQFNGCPVTLVRNCQADDFAKLVRTSDADNSKKFNRTLDKKYNYDLPYKISIENVLVSNGKWIALTGNSKSRITIKDSAAKNMKLIFEAKNGAKVTVENVTTC